MNPGPEAAQARRIFGDALDCPPEERAALLDAACGGNESLRRELESLLRLHPAAGRFFDRAVPPTVHSGSTLPDQFEGVTIGAYRILDEVATGGMGSVYRAERTDQAFQKMVAIKLIRAGLLSPDAVARFKTERQVLADLEHPGIARLLDGGSTADGMPFLVMEFVDGVPLNRHVAERNPGLAERISLFLEICEAVQYAHQNLVVHRDLKPGNILVDVHGHVKLLDFGIAKVLAPSDANAGQTVAHAFTVRYASPEQVRGGRITTATDIYSLGVILYEMLCGVLPYDLDGVSPASVVDTITTREPEKPSRRADPVIARRLAGDLDMIILKALHKEPERRYATVDELAADLKRQRRGEPVLARPDTAAYRISRFVGRNRGLVAGTLGMIVVLIAALLATLNAYRNAAVSRNNAEFETYIASLAAAEASIVTEKVSEASQHLGKAPPALRGWEWGHLEARLDRSLASFPAHHAGITSLAVAGDGTIAATSVDSTVAILSAEGKVLERHGPFDSAVETARFIDGDRAFVAGLLDGSVIRVERNTGAVRTLFPAGREWAFVSVSPDQRLLAAGFVDGTACVLSLADNRIVREWQAHGVLTVVAYSPDGRYLATAGAEGNVTIHDAKT
ncbi:MAG TPA: serine/threonine-protein kinase, partial [Candidatus Eisenbacteria bacterium]